MAKIEWNKVTWYSKLIAVLVFLATFYIAFNIGREYQALRDENVISAPASGIISDVTFACSAGKTIRAQFYQDSVALELSDGRHLTVPHAISADGARYANADETFVFWTRGQGAFIEEGPQATSGSAQATTYADCVVTK
jgi:membrane-bound inhibitor of C-type lysozyme